ncbi:uncharacterized protein TRIVIDRAFT_224530 [Trichoderma virens Gv29-8]|uniref:Uncharacterized protein n=1 Tax=Hypocrea virens (strain Gv29-8 / FGSC 10586) TaxID=413071 RepID=G9N0H9_HYPVG|nr:uncharacterized protein TRIVIDRAFT_224530 [Trichoderma virens Gv29-8]EHK19861.1 hypothetical protein TRIVIDRAFT_224530 [Trichoderma virens Gv29-8]UKZ53242.1 hypothetical protein TrVGV298_007034 [Trichoderma virens]
MTTKIYPALTEIANVVQETVYSLGSYPENDSISFINSMREIIYKGIYTRYGKKLPKELRWPEKLPPIEALEQPISTKNPSTVEPLAQDNTSIANTAEDNVSTTADNTAEDNTSTTANTAEDDVSTIADRAEDNASTTADNTAEDNTSTTANTAEDDVSMIADRAEDNASTTANTAEDDVSTTADTAEDDVSTIADTAEDNISITADIVKNNTLTANTAKDNASTTADNTAEDNASTTADNTAEDNTSTTADNTAQDDEAATQEAMVRELMDQAADFKLWTENPSSFWNLSIEPLTLQEPTLIGRQRTFCLKVTEESPEATILSYISALDSIVMYDIFKQICPSANYISPYYIQEFLQHLGIPIQEGTEEKFHRVLFGGRRRMEFCRVLSEGKEKLDVNFERFKYGSQMLTLNRRMWWQKGTHYQKQYQKTLDGLKMPKILEAMETTGANLATQILLQFRQECIQNAPTLSDKNDINSTVASKRSCTEAGLDGSVASKRFCAVSDLAALIAAATTHQYANTVEAADDSNQHIMQLNNALSLNPETNNTVPTETYCTPNMAPQTQNLVDTQDGNLGDINIFSNAVLPENEADLNFCNWGFPPYLNSSNWELPQQELPPEDEADLNFCNWGFPPYLNSKNWELPQQELPPEDEADLNFCSWGFPPDLDSSN